jgi:hypothetical protein
MNGFNTSANCLFSGVFKYGPDFIAVNPSDRQLSIIDNYMDCAEPGYLPDIDNI